MLVCFFLGKLEGHIHPTNLQLEAKLSHFGSPTKFLTLLSAVSMCPVWPQEEECFTTTLFGVSPRDSCDYGQSCPGMRTNFSCGGNPRKRVQFRAAHKAVVTLGFNKLSQKSVKLTHVFMHFVIAPLNHYTRHCEKGQWLANASNTPQCFH